MKTYPRIAARLYSEPWQITSSKFQEIATAYQKAVSLPDWQAADDPVGPKGKDFLTKQTIDLHPQVEVVQGVAVARVHGVTGKGLSALSMQCGGFDTGIFRQQIANVAADPTIHTILIDFNSPGGMAAGNIQVYQDLRNLSAQGVKVIGFASGMCASAAYYIACGCDVLFADPDAVVGSISTIYSGEDTSGAWAMEGRELKLFATGKFKATGMDGKPWTADEEAMIWERIYLLDGEFKSTVKAARPGLSSDAMEGQWWYAKHAPKGLIDSIEFESLSALLESILSKP